MDQQQNIAVCVNIYREKTDAIKEQIGLGIKLLSMSFKGVLMY